MPTEPRKRQQVVTVRPSGEGGPVLGWASGKGPPRGARPEPGDLELTRADDGRLKSVQHGELEGRRWLVEMLWESKSHRLEPAAVRVLPYRHDAPVRADVLRRLPLGTFQQEVRRRAAEYAHLFEGLDIGHPIRRDVDAAALAAELTTPTGHRGVALTGRELEEIAAVYLEAWGRGEEVTMAVAEHFHIARSTAGKRIMKARKAGFLDSVRRITR